MSVPAGWGVTPGWWGRYRAGLVELAERARFGDDVYQLVALARRPLGGSVSIVAASSNATKARVEAAEQFHKDLDLRGEAERYEALRRRTRYKAASTVNVIAFAQRQRVRATRADVDGPRDVVVRPEKASVLGCGRFVVRPRERVVLTAAGQPVPGVTVDERGEVVAATHRNAFVRPQESPGAAFAPTGERLRGIRVLPDGGVVRAVP